MKIEQRRNGICSYFYFRANNIIPERNLHTLVLLLLLASINCSLCIVSALKEDLSLEPSLNTKEAYVTLIYGDTYGLPARILFQSLKETNTQKGLIVIVTSDVNEDTRMKLGKLGVRVIEVNSVSNPYAAHNPRFEQVMSKLFIWNLTEYDKLVYLDADAMVFENIDELFSCGEFCVVFINPWTFNSGVMVLKPRTTVYEDMLEKMKQLGSYDGGDQGFLNNYYPNMLSSPLFDRNHLETIDPNGHYRLPASYHVDHVLYYPRFSWRNIKPLVVEFLGVPLIKPWLWWSYPFMEVSWQWLAFRNRLPEECSDDILDRSTIKILGIIPLIAIILFAQLISKYIAKVNLWMRLHGRQIAIIKYIQLYDLTDSTLVHLFGLSGLLIYLISGIIGWSVVPATLKPFWGWFLFYWWSYSLTFLLFSGFCWFCYYLGELDNLRVIAQKKSHFCLGADNPMKSSFCFAAFLIMFNVSHMSLVSKTIYDELFVKISILVFGIFFTILFHYIFLSKIAHDWFVYGLHKRDQIAVSIQYRLSRRLNWYLVPLLLLFSFLYMVW